MNKINLFVKRLYKNVFLRNVAILVTGTASAQIIIIIFVPIITRLYGPEALGILGTFSAISAVVTSVAALSYPFAIVLPKEDCEAKQIAFLSLLIAIGSAIFLMALFFFVGDYILKLLKAELIGSYILLIPLAIIFVAWFQINQQWLIRKKKFNILSKVNIIFAFCINSFKTIIGLQYPSASILILTYTFSNAIQGVLLFISASKSKKENVKFERDHLWITAKKYYDFPVYRSPEVLLNAISHSLPPLMLSAFFGPKFAGFYLVSSKLLHMPIQLIGKSVANVFYPRINEAAYKKENIAQLLFKSVFGLFVVGIIPFGVIVIWGPSIFGYILGEQWTTTGIYARWMALWLFIEFINRPCITAIPVIKLQGHFLIFTTVGLTLKALSIIGGYYFFDSHIYSIALFSISGALLNIFIILFVIFQGITGKRHYRREIISV